MPAAKTLKRYGLITVACALYALGFNWFFVPNHFTVGGFTGVAQIINHFLPMLPVGTIALVLNIPLFILGWQKIGRDLLISSLYATAVSSLMIDLLASIHTFSPMDPILACIYGGIVSGIGCGLLTCFIRRFGSYPEGVCYSILIMNCTTWLLDKYIRPTIYGAPKKEKKEAAAK